MFENEDMCTINQTIISQIVSETDKYTKQVIRDYVMQQYPKGNVQLNFINKEIVDEIIDLGIQEYIRRHK